jgi:hypothetical protein
MTARRIIAAREPCAARRGLLAIALTAAIAIAIALASSASASEPFGVELLANPIVNQDGSPATQAGGHPFAMTTTVMFNHRVLEEEEGITIVSVAGDPKSVEVNLPAGLVVNPLATETRCSEVQLTINRCPRAAAVGTVRPFLNTFGGGLTAALYNMVPPPGVPAELAFNLNGYGIIPHIMGRVRTGSDYGLSAVALDIPKEHTVYGIKVTVWGSPSDTSHDKERGSAEGECGDFLGQEKVKREEREIEEHGREEGRVYFCPVVHTDKPLLAMPGACTGVPLSTTTSVNSWQEPEAFAHAASTSSPVTGCGQLDFSPRFAATPDTTAADSPAGLSVDLKVPQEESARGLAEANLKDASVTLPAGLAVSPSAANGLGACAPEQIGLSNPNAPSCPESSKIGSVEVVTPLLEHPLQGSVYLAQQGANPFGSLLALYLVAEGAGTLIKLAGHVEADTVTGQLTTTFKNNPQLPFSDLKLNFFGGPRAALVTPQACGTYETNSVLTPWSGTPAANLGSTFSITSGPGGGPCPTGQFTPSFTSGTTNSQAGGYSPFSTTFGRQDGEQRLSGIQVHTPPGLLGVLKSVVRCPEPQASLGTCGSESQIGHTTTGAGPGPDQFYVGGNVFLTGPYRGAPFGLSVVVHAVAGPFDLGNVIVRARINVDPSTAQITVTSDPLPTILQGIPLDLRTINVTVDRPGFMFNPTSCERMSITGTIASTAGGNAPVSSPFQAVNCASLPFKPTFQVSTQAKTSKANGASLDVKIAQNPGDANIRKVDVTLPLALPSRLTTLQKACAQAQFEANPAQCPEGSFVGVATARTPVLAAPLTGPALLVSHGGAAFPDLVIVLQAEGIRIDLVGNTDIKKGLTFSRFETVPDAPISSFELSLPEGPHSALAAYGSLCVPTTTVTVKQRVRHALRNVQRVVPAPLVMPTTMTGQNGAVMAQSTKIAVSGCARANTGKARKARRASRVRAREGRH